MFQKFYTILLFLTAFVGFANAQAPNYPISGLIGYYGFNGNNFDASLPFRNPAVVNAMEFTADRNGAANRAALFTKNNGSYIEIDMVQHPQFKANQFTIAFWVRTSTPGFFNGGDEPTVVSIGNSTRVGFKRSVNGLNHFARYQNAIGPIQGEWWFSEVNPTVWHHVLITGSDAGINFYVDGNQPPITPGSFGNPVTYVAGDDKLVIGANALLGANSFFDGAVDDIFIYNRVVSPAERTQIKDFYSTTPAPAPITITTPLPATTLACSNQITLSVAAESEQTLTYVWFGPNFEPLQNNFKFSGVNTPNLTINGVTASDNGFYSCQISNASINALSTQTNLTRANPVQFNALIDLQNNVVSNPVFCAGNSITLGYQNANSTTLQWHKDGVPIGPANQTFLFFTNLNASQNGTYVLHGTNQCGTVLSPPLVVDVLSAPQITVQPSFNQPICQFQPFTAQLSFQGTGITQIEWRRNNQVIPGASDFTLEINQTGQYRAFVSGPCGATVATTPLTIEGFFPAITQNPISVSACPGEPASFSITVANDINLPVTYQWILNGTPIDGATNATYEIASVSANDFGQYTCKIVQNGCERTSAVASLQSASQALISANQGYYPIRSNSFANRAQVANPLAPEIAGLEFGEDAFGVEGSAFRVGSANNSYFRSMPGAGSASQSAWVKYQGASSALYQTIFSQGFSNSNVLLAVANDGRLIWGNNALGDFNNYPGVPTLPENEWTHIAITRNNNAIQLYLNGVEVVNADIAPKNFLGNYLGGIFSLPFLRFNGWFDEVRFFNRSLTFDEVQSIYQSAIISSNIEQQTITGCSPYTNQISLPVNSFTPDNLNLQWFRDGVAVPNANQATIEFDGINADASGNYTLVGFTGCLSFEIDAFVLNVNNAPQLISTSNDADACLGESLTLEAEVLGGDLTFQWLKDGVEITGATEATLVLDNLGVLNAGNYSIRAQNSCGEVTSNPINVLINALPVIFDASESTIVCEGGNLELFVEVTNTDLVEYQWQKNGVDILGANGSTYTITNATAADATDYRVIVSNNCGVTQSDLINITLNPPYAFTLQPQGATLCEGETFGFSIGINSFNNLSPENTFQWFKDGVLMENIIFAQPTFTNASPALSGTWVLQVNTLFCGSFSSQPAVVQVNPIPVVTVEPISAVCAGESVTLTASGADSFVWSGGVENGVAFVPNESAQFTVVGTSNGCASAPITVNLTVNPIPVVTVEPISAVCAGESVTLTASGADAFTWSGGVENGVAFVPAASGTFTVVGTTNGCESIAVTVSVEVNEFPTLEISAPAGICGPGEVTISSTSNGTITFPNGFINGVAIFLTQNLTLEISANNNGCVTSQSVTVEVNQAPNLQITGTSQVCSGNAVTLTATGANQITWTGGIENGVPFTPTETVTYTVTGVNVGCPAQTLNYTVTVLETPVITVEPIEPICLGDEVTLTASGANGHFWDGGVENGVPFTPTATSTFTVFGNSNGCDSEQITVTVVVNPLPEPVVNYNSTLERLETGVFESYQWYFNGVLITGANQQFYSTVEDGIYTVVVTNTNNCEGESTEFILSTVSVKELANGVGFNLYPNPAREQITLSFTDNLNTQVELHIYDLTGKQLGSTRINQTSQTVDVTHLNEGVYLFRLIGSTLNQTQRVVIKK
ncbi:MAG: immunoglobulin domain-containing protein [Luteibaculaceae bacterium]